MERVITLTTDFGWGSPYVAAMKGVILAINPAARIIDISHGVKPQNIRQAALLLAESTTLFPRRTVHVAVVDPGVGSTREILCAQIDDQWYIAPDNGLLSRLTQKSRPTQMVALENPEHWLPSISSTFHGRDIIAPVAAQLSLGMEPDRLGGVRSTLVELDWPTPEVGEKAIRGSVLWVDSFGNLITDISLQHLATIPNPATATVEIAGQAIGGIVRAYSNRPSGSLVALVGSSGLLEIAVSGGSAEKRLSGATGHPVKVRW